MIEDINRRLKKRHKSRIPLMTTSVDELKKNGYSKEADDWVDFCEELFLKNSLSLLGTRSIWYKMPVLMSESNFFTGKRVIDIGGMCGLSTFIILKVFKADSCIMMDHYPLWIEISKTPLEKRFKDKVDVRLQNIDELIASTKCDENTVVYLSDMLYQFNDKKLSKISNWLRDVPGVSVVAHSREERKNKRKNSRTLCKHLDLKKFLESFLDDVEYKDERFQRDQNVMQEKIKKNRELRFDEMDPHLNWVTIIGKNRV